MKISASEQVQGWLTSLPPVAPRVWLKVGEVGVVEPTRRAFLKRPDATSRIPNGDVWSLDIFAGDAEGI